MDIARPPIASTTRPFYRLQLTYRPGPERVLQRCSLCTSATSHCYKSARTRIRVTNVRASIEATERAGTPRWGQAWRMVAHQERENCVRSVPTCVHIETWGPRILFCSRDCPSCNKRLIERRWFVLSHYHLKANCCGFCGAEVAGQFGEGLGAWGSNRVPVSPSQLLHEMESP